MQNINNVFVSYSDGFPVSFCAANTKVGFLGKGLVQQGDRVVLINKFYGKKNIAPTYGCHDGILYYSLPNKGNKIKKSIFNTYRTCKILKKEIQPYNVNVAYIGCGNFFILVVISLYARMYGYKVAFIYEELQAKLDMPFINRVNGWLHSYYMGYFVDCVLPISEYLSNVSKRWNKPMFKLPICADFSESDKVQQTCPSQYFVYCAAAGYHRSFLFILDAFEHVCQSHPEAKLHIVLSGSEQLIAKDKKIIGERNMNAHITIMTKLPYNTLLSEYKKAQALLIPLFNDVIGDVARFSQKISEYLSTKRPVISTGVGEINHYFQHKNNMLIDYEITPESYANLMLYSLEHPNDADIIGERGFKVGLKQFDYKVLSKRLHNFLIN